MPISIPETISPSSARRGSGPAFRFFSRIYKRIHRPPRIPLEKARKADETGIYLLNTPIVPKMSIEAMIIITDLRSFRRLSILSPPICS